MIDAIEVENREFYDGVAADYHRLRYGKSYHRRVAEYELDFLIGALPRDVNFLEVGPGTGRVTELLLKISRKLLAVDLSSEMLAQLRLRLGGDEKLETAVSNVFDLESVTGYGSFDCCVSMRVLSHIEDINRAIALLSGAVRPGGTVAVDLWNAWGHDAVAKKLGIRRRAVYTRYDTIRTMRGYLRKAGLEITTMRGFGLPPVPPFLPLERRPVLGSDRLGQRILWICRRIGEVKVPQ